MRWRIALLAPFLLGLLAVPPVHAEGEDFRIDLDAYGVRFTGLGVSGSLKEEKGGERLVWELAMDPDARSRIIGLVVENGYFDRERPRQMVPTVEGRYLVVVPFSVDGTENPARVLNVTQPGGQVRMRMAFPANETGRMELALVRDVDAPGLTVGRVRDVTHFSFYLETTSTEPAVATLSIRPASGGESVIHPTPSASTLHRFPIQGLDPDREYVFHVTFEDWAGNLAASDNYTMRTLPREDRPGPNVTMRFPEPGVVLQTRPERVEAAFEALPGTAVDPSGGVRLWVDKSEVTSHAAIGPDRIRYDPPEPLGAGPHTVNLEITDSMGGKTVSTWRFEVDAQAESPSVAPLVFVLAAAGVAVARRGARAVA